MRISSRVLLVLVALHFSLANAKEQRPNVVFILTDDQAPWALSLSGHPHANTPNLDKLFKQGMWLKKAYVVTPVCSPSRAALMTSRYGSELGIKDWIHPRNEPNLGLDPKTVTWTEAMQAEGYHTGLVGKWHLGVPDKFHPTKTGFDYFMGFRTGGNKVTNPTLEVEGKNQKVEGFTYDILTDDALKFIERNQKKTFLLCLHYRAPHAAWMPQPESDRKPFDKLDPQIPNPDYPNLDVARVKRMTREYLGSVKGVDRNVGRVLKQLDDLKLADNTIVVFTSDHGYSIGHNGIWYKADWPNVCYGEYSTLHQSKTHMRMIRTANWKLVRDFLNPVRDELFDLKNDPAESQNVIKAGKNAAVTKELHGMILARMREVKDPVLKQLQPKIEN